MKPLDEIHEPELQAYAAQAIAFLKAFRWCDDVTACWLAFGIAGIVGVFRMDIVPREGADPTVWVVVGDLPPAYLAFEPNDSWQDALRGYVEEMRLWTDAARDGADVSELIPVNVSPTPEHAAMLASRLDFIERNLIDVPADSIEGEQPESSDTP